MLSSLENIIEEKVKRYIESIWNAPSGAVKHPSQYFNEDRISELYYEEQVWDLVAKNHLVSPSMPLTWKILFSLAMNSGCISENQIF
ncbi:MAG: hypothetical protein R2860_14025 [Desulfobacterales bacterium]